VTPSRLRGGAGLRRILPVLIAGRLLILAPGAPGAPAGGEPTLVQPPFGHCLGITRVGTFHLFLYLGTATSFSEPAGLTAVKLRSQDDPATEHDDDELTVFGLNSGRSEIIYNTSLTSVAIYGEPGRGDGQFDRPRGIAADEWGTVVVADTGNDRIVRLRYDGDELVFISSIAEVPASPPLLDGPSDVALGVSGRIYVTDSGNDRLLAFAPDGSLVMQLTGDPEVGVELEAPVGLAVVEDDDPHLDRRAGRIVVIDRAGTRLLSFGLDGRLRNSTTAGEGTSGSARFDYLAIDYHGSVYATDTRGGRIHKFTRHLDHVTTIESPGADGGDLDEPRGLTIWRRFGQVFVAERTGAQYFWMGTDVQDLEIDGGRFVPGVEPLRVRYHLTEISRVTVSLVDPQGRTIHTLADERRRAIGPNVERWDGLLPDGSRLPAGEYALTVRARPVYSSQAYFHDTESIRIIATH